MIRLVVHEVHGSVARPSLEKIRQPGSSIACARNRARPISLWTHAAPAQSGEGRRHSESCCCTVPAARRGPESDRSESARRGSGTAGPSLQHHPDRHQRLLSRDRDGEPQRHRRGKGLAFATGREVADAPLLAVPHRRKDGRALPRQLGGDGRSRWGIWTRASRSTQLDADEGLSKLSASADEASQRPVVAIGRPDALGRYPVPGERYSHRARGSGRRGVATVSTVSCARS